MKAMIFLLALNLLLRQTGKIIPPGIRIRADRYQNPRGPVLFCRSFKEVPVFTNITNIPKSLTTIAESSSSIKENSFLRCRVRSNGQCPFRTSLGRKLPPPHPGRLADIRRRDNCHPLAAAADDAAPLLQWGAAVAAETTTSSPLARTFLPRLSMITSAGGMR